MARTKKAARGRPKLFKDPSRLEVVIERTAKRKAFSLATDRKISMGRLFEELVEAEERRLMELKGVAA